MPHPLSEIITAKLNGSDPHARTTLTNAEAVQIRIDLDEAFRILGEIRDIVKHEPHDPHVAWATLNSMHIETAMAKHLLCSEVVYP